VLVLVLIFLKLIVLFIVAQFISDTVLEEIRFVSPRTLTSGITEKAHFFFGYYVVMKINCILIDVL